VGRTTTATLVAATAFVGALVFLALVALFETVLDRSSF